MDYKTRLELNLKLYYLTSIFSSLIFVAPIWVKFLQGFMNFAQMSFIFAFGTTVTVILELPTGALADLIGRRKTMILGWACLSMYYILASFSSSFYYYFVFFIFHGIGMALVSGAEEALFFDTLKELKKEYMASQIFAKYGLIHRIGLAVATFFGGYLFLIWTGLPYFLVGIASLVVMLAIFFMVEPKIDSEQFSFKNYIKQTKVGFGQIFKTKYIKTLSFYFVLVAAITWLCLTYYNLPFAYEVGFNEIQNSWIYSSSFILTSFILLAITKLENKISKNTIFVFAFIFMLIALLPGIFVNKTYAILSIFLLQLVGSGRFAFLAKYTNMEFESKYRATAISALNMLVSLLYAAVILIGGVIQDIYGTKLIFTLLGLLTLLLLGPITYLSVKNQKV